MKIKQILLGATILICCSVAQSSQRLEVYKAEDASGKKYIEVVLSFFYEGFLEKESCLRKYENGDLESHVYDVDKNEVRSLESEGTEKKLMDALEQYESEKKGWQT